MSDSDNLLKDIRWSKIAIKLQMFEESEFDENSTIWLYDARNLFNELVKEARARRRDRKIAQSQGT